MSGVWVSGDVVSGVWVSGDVVSEWCVGEWRCGV